MRNTRLLALLVTASLIGVPALAVSAAPASATYATTQRAPARTLAAGDPADADAAQYAEREAKDESVAEFRGGDRVVVVSVSTVVVVLLVVILVLAL